MKNYQLFCLFAFMLLPLTSKAQEEERLVHDPHLENQIKFTYGWEQGVIPPEDLTPQWWYRVFDHNYINNYYNNFHETYWTKYASITTDTLTKRQQRDVDTIYLKRMKEFAYRTVDLAYLLEINEIRQKQAEFDIYYIKIRDSETPNCEALANDMKELFDEVIGKFDAIKQAHLENHKRQEAYVAYQDELDDILWHTKKLFKLTELAKHNIFGN